MSVKKIGILGIALAMALGGLVSTAAAAETGDWNVRDVRIFVPENLTVSEANLHFPGSDIVWREDPLGDRKAQIKKIMDDSISLAARNFHGSRRVYLDVTVKRFHALTEKARYTTGGRHALEFYVVLRDVKTGADLTPTELVNASFPAFGGNEAIEADARGDTQKVRISRQLHGIFHRYLRTH